MSAPELLVAVLVVWRVTHLLAAEDGPGGILAALRRAMGAGFWGELLDCFYCLSLWVALPPALLLGEGWRDRLLLWPALSGAAILLERATGREDPSLSAAAQEPEVSWPAVVTVGHSRARRATSRPHP